MRDKAPHIYLPASPGGLAQWVRLLHKSLALMYSSVTPYPLTPSKISCAFFQPWIDTSDFSEL